MLFARAGATGPFYHLFPEFAFSFASFDEFCSFQGLTGKEKGLPKEFAAACMSEIPLKQLQTTGSTSLVFSTSVVQSP